MKMIIKIQGMCLLLKILVFRAQSEHCDFQNMSLPLALYCILSQANLDLVHLIYTHEDNYSSSVNEISLILDAVPMKQIHISSFIQYESHLATHLPEVVTLSNIEQMRSRLFFLVICSDTCTNRLLQSAHAMDTIYGWDLLLHNFALWLIITPSCCITSDTERLMFDNTLVFTDISTTPINITMMTSKQDCRCLQSVGRSLSDNPFSLRMGGLNGKQMTVVAMEWAPFTIERKDNGRLDFVGISRNVLDELATTFNFTFVIPEDGLWGSVDEHGNWSGVVGMLQRKKADICIAPYSSTEERQKVMSYGYFFIYEEVVVVYRQPGSSQNQWKVLVSGFKSEVYLFGLLALVAATFLFLVVHFISRSLRGQRVQSMRVFITDVIISVWGVPLTQMDAALFAPMTSVRLLIFSWWLFCIIMTSVYKGNLIAAFTVSREVTPFRTLQDLVVNKDFEVDVVGGTQIEMILKTSEMRAFRATWKRIRQSRESQPFMKSAKHTSYQKQRVRSGGYALITPMNIAEDLVNGDCSVRLMKEKIIPIYTSFVFPLNSPLAKLFGHQMKHMVETGLVEKWKRQWSPKKKICFDSETFINIPIYISAIFSAIVAASGGITLAAIVLFCEYTFSKRTMNAK